METWLRHDCTRSPGLQQRVCVCVCFCVCTFVCLTLQGLWDDTKEVIQSWFNVCGCEKQWVMNESCSGYVVIWFYRLVWLVVILRVRRLFLSLLMPCACNVLKDWQIKLLCCPLFYSVWFHQRVTTQGHGAALKTCSHRNVSQHLSVNVLGKLLS